MTTILSTKKLKKSVKKKLTDANLKVIEKKFIKIKKLNFKVIKFNDFVIFTSKNAVKSLLKSDYSSSIKLKKIFCVGQKTKKFLEKNHFIVQENANYASEIGLIITTKYRENTFSFFSGNLRNDSLPTLLNENKIQWNEVVVYKTALNPKKIKEQVNGILFFSPTAVESYLTKNKIENQTCFCIGTTTAKTLENRTQNIKIAAQPSVENVIKEVIKYYN